MIRDDFKKNWVRKYKRHMMVSMLSCLFLSSSLACAETTDGDMPARCDNAHFAQDRAHYNYNFKSFSTKHVSFKDSPEHICGTVTKVFRSKKTKSGLHGYFLLLVDNGKPIKIVVNLEEMTNAPAWPWVNEGDDVEVEGRYYFDSPQKQGVDWTHHGNSPKWGWPGFVIVGGQRYE